MKQNTNSEHSNTDLKKREIGLGAKEELASPADLVLIVKVMKNVKKTLSVRCINTGQTSKKSANGNSYRFLVFKNYTDGLFTSNHEQSDFV